MDHSIDRQSLTRLLESTGLRATQQRLRVAEILVTAPIHLTAEQVIGMMASAGTTVSKATVYNTLHVLAQHGLIRPLHLDPTRVVYDSKRVHHHHFHHTETGELTDVAVDDIKFQNLPVPPPGTEIESVEVVIRIRRKTT